MRRAIRPRRGVCAALPGIKPIQRLIVRDEILHLLLVAPRLAVQHFLLRQAGLDGRQPRSHGIGPPDREPEERDDAAREPEQVGELAGPVARRADVAGAEPERLGGHGGVLAREPRVDRRHRVHLGELEADAGRPVPSRHPGQAAQVGAEHEEHPRLADELLVAAEPRRRRLALRVFDRHHAPRLQVGRRGRALRRCNQELEGPGRERRLLVLGW